MGAAPFPHQPPRPERRGPGHARHEARPGPESQRKERPASGDGHDPALFEELRILRKQIADSSGVPRFRGLFRCHPYRDGVPKACQTNVNCASLPASAITSFIITAHPFSPSSTTIFRRRVEIPPLFPLIRIWSFRYRPCNLAPLPGRSLHG